MVADRLELAFTLLDKLGKVQTVVERMLELAFTLLDVRNARLDETGLESTFTLLF